MKQTAQSVLGTDITNIKAPIGYRKNNPLNIRENFVNGKDTTEWQGEQVNEPEIGKNQFEEFENMHYGCRAAVKLLMNYATQGFKNVYQIINRWAPPSDGNNPTAYIKMVLEDLGLQTNNHYSEAWIPTNKESYARLAYAMSKVEIGAKYRPSLETFINAANTL